MFVFTIVVISKQLTDVQANTEFKQIVRKLFICLLSVFRNGEKFSQNTNHGVPVYSAQGTNVLPVS